MTGTISARRERHYGIRVQGLGNRLGQRAVLEADIATVELDPAARLGSSPASAPLDYPRSPTPKPDRRSSDFRPAMSKLM